MSAKRCRARTDWLRPMRAFIASCSTGPRAATTAALTRRRPTCCARSASATRSCRSSCWRAASWPARWASKWRRSPTSSSGSTTTRRRSSPDGCRRPSSAISNRSCRPTPRRSPATTASANTRGRHPAIRAAWRSSNRPSAACSSISTARTCSAPTWASSAARSARCSATPVRSAKASATSRASSARSARTRCSTAPRLPTARSCRRASATTRSRCAIATVTSRSSRASRSAAASRCSCGRRAIATASSGRFRPSG